MGLTDAPQQTTLEEVFPEGTPFVVQQAWFEGPVQTQYGKRAMAKVVVIPLGGDTPQEFSVWGSMCEQVQSIKGGELPMTVTWGKDGNRKLFKAYEVGPDEAIPAGQPTADEAALGVTPGAGEGAPPAQASQGGASAA